MAILGNISRKIYENPKIAPTETVATFPRDLLVFDSFRDLRQVFDAFENPKLWVGGANRAAYFRDHTLGPPPQNGSASLLFCGVNCFFGWLSLLG